MATLKEQNDLIEVLKFTPRTYKISIWGYGGEKVMGTVPKESWDYCMEHQVDLMEIAWGDEERVRDDMGLDIDRLPFYPGSWYECDNMAHVNGASRSAGTLQIEDENDETVFEKSLDEISGYEDIDGNPEPEWECGEEVWIGQEEAGKVVFLGNSNEKGTFFEANLELTAPFDITKLTLIYDEVDGEEIVHSVRYDGEEIDNWGGSTDGKSSDFTMCLVGEDGEWTRYEPGEKDWGHPEYGTSPEGWEKTQTFKFKKTKPTIPGYYNAVWNSFGTSTTYGSLYWNGENFGEWEYGKFILQSNVKTWSGFNWDTSDWSNRPPEPPNLVCDNKECGWVGDSNDRRTDDDYNNYCPECDGTEFSWIDYDPDTALGRKNRANYCRRA
jgi:hypothetical protein